MSTYVRVRKDDQSISIEDLKRYFHSFAKPISQHALGLEWELFGVSPETGQALPYFGSRGIEAVLKLLTSKFGYQTIEEESHVIALFKGENYVALEPGGQLELSAEPVATVHDVKNQLENFQNELVEITRSLNIAWLNIGFHPFSKLDEIEWVPKKRYQIMKEYLAKKGAWAHDMMKRTAANQVNIDFSNELDAMEKLKIIYGITSLVSALFANSSLSEGKFEGFLIRRLASWRQTDPNRTGLIPVFLREASTFDDYLAYVLETPMIFIIRGNAWIPMQGLPFREFLRKGYSHFRATLEDFELHLSTLFPEARIKNCIEIRGTDGQPFDLIPSVPALWKGILYDQEARLAAWQLVKDFSWEERCAFHLAIEKEGPRAFLGKFRGWDLIKEIFSIAKRGLKSQGKLNSQGEDETVYLDALFERVIKPEKTSAETLVEKWQKDFRETPKLLINHVKL